MKLTRKRRITGEQPQLEMTPMIDVVFQLLIFFVVAIKQDDILSMLSAARPTTPAVREPPVNVVDIEINKAGFAYRGTPLSKAMLDRRLTVIADGDKNASVVIRCTGDSPHAYLVQVLDVCHKLELTNLAVFSM